jgi:cytochrome c553
MKMRSLLLQAVLAGVAILFLAAGIQAATEVPDVIKLESPGYEKHEKGIVEFTHKKHSEDYAKKAPDFYKNGCGECHHDADNKPLTNLKAGDDVKRCIECHKKPGEKPKGKGKPKLSKSQELEYHAEALHDNCRVCHKKYNKANKTKAAPTTCTKCHPKKKK